MNDEKIITIDGLFFYVCDGAEIHAHYHGMGGKDDPHLIVENRTGEERFNEKEVRSAIERTAKHLDIDDALCSIKTVNRQRLMDCLEAIDSEFVMFQVKGHDRRGPILIIADQHDGESQNLEDFAILMPANPGDTLRPARFLSYELLDD